MTTPNVKRTASVAAGFLLLSAVLAGAAQIVNYGSVIAPTSLNDLNMTGTFRYAINLREGDSQYRTVTNGSNSVIFTADGGVGPGNYPVPAGYSRSGGNTSSYSIGSLFGSSELAEIMRRVYWGAQTYTLAVSPNVTYQLQLFFWSDTARNFNINVDARPGVEVQNLAILGGSAPFLIYNGTFTPTGNTLQIALTAGTDPGDTNAIMSAFTLVPEPTALTLLALSGLALLRRRRR